GPEPQRRSAPGTLRLPPSDRVVFTGRHCPLLADLFNRRFEGYLASASEGNPPWYGSWLPHEARESITDRHMLFVLYTTQPTEADPYDTGAAAKDRRTTAVGRLPPRPGRPSNCTTSSLTAPNGFTLWFPPCARPD